MEIWQWVLFGVVTLNMLNVLRMIWFGPKVTWMRFVFETEHGKIKGAWVRHDQEKIDSMFEIYSELAQSGVDYFHVDDKRGDSIIIPSGMAAKTTVKIQTKKRYF